jgi:hypothetical protein
MNLIDQLNSHNYLYLDSLIDKGELKIELTISEASSECWDGETKDLDDLTELHKAELFKKRLCKKYKITFENYICYSMINESLTIWDDYEQFEGNLFRIYSKSRFLDYTKVAVYMFIVENTQEDKVKHFGILCLNNIIDIATCQEIKIEEIL